MANSEMLTNSIDQDLTLFQELVLLIDTEIVGDLRKVHQQLLDNKDFVLKGT